MEVNTYTARVTRDEDAWMIEVPEVERVTQALSLRQVEEMARDLIAIMTDTEPDSFELVIEWPTDIATSLDAYRAKVAAAEKAAEDAVQARLDAAATLQGEGATVRDIGALMGVSFQRAQQIIEAARKASGADVALPERTVLFDARVETRQVRRQATRDQVKP